MKFVLIDIFGGIDQYFVIGYLLGSLLYYVFEGFIGNGYKNKIRLGNGLFQVIGGLNGRIEFFFWKILRVFVGFCDCIDYGLIMYLEFYVVIVVGQYIGNRSVKIVFI